jgi:hypothetical protein
MPVAAAHAQLVLTQADDCDQGASMFNPANIQMGMVVRDRDGERLGTVSAVDAGGFFIGKGHPFASDHRLAFSDVMDLDGDDVYLRESAASLTGGYTETTLTARATTVTAAEPPLHHDLTGGLGRESRDWERVPTDSARAQDSHPPMSGGLGLAPRDLEQARMDSAKFQDHGRYDVGAGATARPEPMERERRREDLISDVDPAVVAVRQPPVVVERRAARDEDEAPRRDAPSDLDPSTRR